MPALQIEQQTRYQRRIGLIVNRSFQPPFVAGAAKADLIVAVLNGDAVDLFPIEIEDLLRLPRRFGRVRPIHFVKLQVKAKPDDDDE